MILYTFKKYFEVRGSRQLIVIQSCEITLTSSKSKIRCAVRFLYLSDIDFMSLLFLVEIVLLFRNRNTRITRPQTSGGISFNGTSVSLFYGKDGGFLQCGNIFICLYLCKFTFFKLVLLLEAVSVIISTL